MKELDVGELVGNKYVLVRLLGAGAMGQVWAARHQALQQIFAVKLMVPPSNDSAVGAIEGASTSLRRFENEAQIAAALSRKSRHIVGVTDYGIDDGVAYLVMELLEGDGLDKRIGDGSKLHPAEVSNIITQIAKGLAVAHAEGVTHRDLKPANVFLTHTEEGDMLVKLLDFGIAQMARRIVKKEGGEKKPTKLTMRGLVLGSPSYMSPEQAMAESPDVRADVWSLAVLAYEAIAGVTPFHANGPDEVLLRICNFQHTPLRERMPEASEELANVFEQAFAPNVEKRFQTAPGFAGALAAALPAPARRLTTERPSRAAPTDRKQAVTGSDGAVSLKIPIRPRKLVPAIGVGLGSGLLLAAAIFGPRVLSSSSKPANEAELSRAMSPTPPGSASAVIPPPPPPLLERNVTVLAVDPPVRPTPQASKQKAVTATSATRDTPMTPTPTPTKSVDRSTVF